MSLISSKTLSIGTGIDFGGEMSAFTAVQSYVFSAAGDFVLPLGDWWIPAQANMTVEYSANGSATTPVWSTLFSAGAGGFVRSDGANIRVAASAAATLNYFGPV